MSVRYQITLPEDLAAELKAAARRQGVSLAQFIRETMEQELASLRDQNVSDPFGWMDGLADLDATDSVARVGGVLYGDGGLR